MSSPSFRGLSLVKQHQMVMRALQAEFDTERLHALELRTVTPPEAADPVLRIGSPKVIS